MPTDLVPRFAIARSGSIPRSGMAPATWSTPRDLVLVVAGAAIGFGDFWTFPPLVARYGGSAFLLLYLGCLALVGLPLLVAELSLGAYCRQSGPSARRPRGHRLVAWVGGIGGLLTLATYVVAAAWALGGAGWVVAPVGMGGEAGFAARRFSALLANPLRLILLQTLFVSVVVLIAARGVRGGLQRAARWAVPLMLTLLAAGVVWQAAVADGYLTALATRLRPDFSRLGPEAVLHAAAQAFFTLSLATGAVFTAGRCRPDGTELRRAAFAIVGLDTMAAGLATLLILPSFPFPGGIVSEGPGLLFVALPTWLGQQPGGPALGGSLCLALSLAALSSATVMLEPSVVWIERRTGLGRRASALAGGALVWMVALVGSLSFSSWRDFRVAGAPLFEGLSFLGADLLLPLGGLGVALLAGWTDLLDRSLPRGRFRRVIVVLLRYVIPGVLLAILGADLASW